MKKFLLNEVTEHFLYLTTGIGFLFTLMMGMMEVPDDIITPVAIITIALGVLSAYYGTWRGIQRRKGF